MSKSKDLIVLPNLSVTVLKTQDTKEITVGNYDELDTKDRTHIIAYPSDPYSEKAVMALILANIPFRVTTLRESHQKPDWVFEANPLGKVPALYVGSESIWDSTTIDEYLNEVYKLGLLPQDPWEKAVCRSAIALVENMLFTWKNCTGRASSTAEFEQEKKKLKHYFEYIEKRAIVDQKWLVGPYFLGQHLSLVDICFAPLFALINITDEILISKDISPILGFGVHEKEQYSKVLDWKESLMNLPTFWLATGILLGLKQSKLYKDVTTFTKVRQTLKKSVLKNLGNLNGIFYQLYCGYLPSIKTAATAPIEFVKQVGQAFKEVTANQVE